MPDKSVNYDLLSPTNFLARSVEVFPDKTAVIYGDKAYNWTQFQDRVFRLANALKARGIGAGDKVAFVCPNTPPMLEAHYAVPMIGAALVSVNIRLSAGEVSYIIDNIGQDLVTLDPGSVPGFEQYNRPFFEDPEHVYDAFEFTATKSYSNNWSMFASYRYSKLKGNFEGFFRSDNGQSDPSITSLFDFPTNDPDYTGFGGPQFGYLGDIRYQGTTLGAFPLPNNRPHQFRLYGNYTVGGLNLGIGADLGSFVLVSPTDGYLVFSTDLIEPGCCGKLRDEPCSKRA